MSILRRLTLLAACAAALFAFVPRGSASLPPPAPDRDTTILLDRCTLQAASYSGNACPALTLSNRSRRLSPGETHTFSASGTGACSNAWVDQAITVSASADRKSTGHPATITTSVLLRIFRSNSRGEFLWQRSSTPTRTLGLPNDWIIGARAEFGSFRYGISDGNAWGRVTCNTSLTPHP